MKNALLALSTVACILMAHISNAQNPFPTKASIDINNIKGMVLVHGDMNWDPQAGGINQCEFPKGSGKHISHVTSIWMSGYDTQTQLHVSAQTYRQTGNDYWPGPLDNNASLNISTSTDWAKIWKVSFIDIGNHLANSTHTTTNTPINILEWPAKGNPYAKGNNNATLNITKDMAPFVDVNNDGLYNALDGDYPKIKGDQALWWVFSDNGPTHNNTQIQAMGIEVHAMAYAYARNTLIDNVIFYEMELNNESNEDYGAFRVGINADMEIGYFRDDYVGFDSTRRLGYTYNADDNDDNNSTTDTNEYHFTPPIAGFTLLETPGDNNTTIQPAGSFIVYHNDPSSVTGYPTNATEYNYYLRSQIRNGDPVKNDYVGYGIPSNGYGAGTNTNYMFYGNPADTSKWSECSSNNPAGDRRFVLATTDYTFKANSSTTFAFALIATDRGTNTTCPSVDISKIQRVSDTAWKYYANPNSQVSATTLANDKGLELYPNPTSNTLYINTPSGSKTNTYQLLVYDVVGKNRDVNYQLHNNKIEINISNLPSGIYHLIYTDGKLRRTETFVKK